MPGTVSGRKACPLSEPGNTGLPIPSFLPEFNSPFMSHHEGLESPIRNGQRPALWTEKGPRAKDFSTTWLQVTENLVFPDGIYQDRTVTGTCKREQTFLSHPRSISVSSKREKFGGQYQPALTENVAVPLLTILRGGSESLICPCAVQYSSH